MIRYRLSADFLSADSLSRACLVFFQSLCLSLAFAFVPADDLKAQDSLVLGMQLEPPILDPTGNAAAAIDEIVDKGATVKFNEDIVGFVPSRHMEKEDGKKLGKGEVVDFKIIEFNKDFKRVVASHTAIFREQEERNVKTQRRKAAAQNEEKKTTFGDANAQLQALKDKMEADSKK